MIYDGFNVSLDRNSVITMKAIPGHFTTNHFHMTHYLDLEKMKKNALIAERCSSRTCQALSFHNNC